MAEVPRELFVLEAYRELAYIDQDIPLGGGRYLLEPMVIAQLARAAEIGSDDMLLDAGCATGYSSVTLGRLARAAVGVESIPEFVQSARNARKKESPVRRGWIAGPRTLRRGEIAVREEVEVPCLGLSVEG